MKSRAVMRRRQDKTEVNADVALGKKQIPDNSEPWLPGGVRSVADAMWISDQIKAATEREYLFKLPAATAEEAAFMLRRFLTPKVAEAGLHHPEESFRPPGLLTNPRSGPDCHMKLLTLTITLLSGFAVAQVTPAHPDRFTKRDIGGGTSGGVGVLPKDGGASQTVRYTTHIVLSTSRMWTSPDGKIVEGKLIAFEDMVSEAPKGAAAPAIPAPPESPTVVRDGKIRLLIKNKPVVSDLARFSAGDQEFVEQVRKAYARKPAEKP